MKPNWTAEEIAKVLNVTPEAIESRAKKEGWLGFESAHRGEKVLRYPTNMLPGRVRLKVVASVVIEKMKKREKAES